VSSFTERTEGHLVEAARAGERDAYADLVRLHQAVAFRVAWSVLGNPEEAEDATQEAFIKVWRQIDRFRPGARFRPWLLAIVANEARNRVRGSNRRRRREFVVAIPDLAFDDPESDVIEDERRLLLHRAVSNLEPRDRDTIVCRYFLELTESETAAVLDIPPGTVKSRLNRARRILALALASDGDPHA
jgi:RNA polymerase sigma-70 factor (ECF subfamily)